MHRGGAGASPALPPLIPDEGLEGLEPPLGRRLRKGARRLRPQERWFYRGPRAFSLAPRAQPNDELLRLAHPGGDSLMGLRPICERRLPGIPGRGRPSGLAPLHVEIPGGPPLFAPHLGPGTRPALDPWARPPQGGAPLLPAPAALLREVWCRLRLTPPGVFGWRLLTGNLAPWVEYLRGHVPRWAPDLWGGAARALRRRWEGGGALRRLDPPAPAWGSLWRRHNSGAPNWGARPPLGGRGPESPWPQVPPRRLFALVNLSLAPETPLAFSLRRLGRGALGGAGGAAFGLPLPHTHTSDPSPLAHEALLGWVPRFGRAVRAALRPPLVRGRPWGEADVPPTPPHPVWAPTPPNPLAGSRPLTTLQGAGPGHMDWVEGRPEGPGYAHPGKGPSRQYSRTAVLGDTAGPDGDRVAAPT